MNCMSGRGWGSCFPHHLPPFEVSEHGNNGVNGKKSGRGVQSFPEVQPGGEEVGCKPQSPLFHILVCQHPHAEDAEHGGKTIAVGHGTVGIADEDKGDKREDGDADGGKRSRISAGKRGDGHFRFAGVAFRPFVPTVDAGKKIVDVDAHVGIKLTVIKDEHIDHGHEDAHGPQPFIGFVFEI